MYNIKILTALIFLMLVEQETSSLDLTAVKIWVRQLAFLGTLLQNTLMT